MVCTDLRKCLSIEITSCIIFIKINGPPIEKFSPDKYVTIWLRSHQCAENKRKTGRQNDKQEITKKGRFQIIDEVILKAISEPRKEVSAFACRIISKVFTQ